MSHTINCIFIITIISLIASDINGFSLRMIPIETPHLQIVPNHSTILEHYQFLANISMFRVLNLPIVDDLAPDSMKSNVYTLMSRFITQIPLGGDDGQNSPFLVLDTGSDFTWIQSEGCNPCFPLTHGKNFNFRESSSFERATIHDPLCIQPEYGVEGSCGFKMVYGVVPPYPIVDGFLGRDDFYLENTQTGNYDVFPNLAFGCTLSSKNFDFGTPNNIGGIFGLAPGRRSFISQLDTQTKRRFSYCLAPFDRTKYAQSTLYFGDDAQIHGDDSRKVETISMHSEKAYHLYLNGISIDGKQVAIDPSVFELDAQRQSKGFFVDSGAPITMLTRSAYDPLREAIVTYFTDHFGLEPLSESGYDLCYRASNDRLTFPSMIFHFRNNEKGEVVDMVMNKNNVFLQHGLGFCVGVNPVNDPGPCLFGAQMQTNFNLLFDVLNSQFSFVPQICQENI